MLPMYPLSSIGLTSETQSNQISTQDSCQAETFLRCRKLENLFDFSISISDRIADKKNW